MLCHEANGKFAQRGAEFIEVCARVLNADQRDGAPRQALRKRNLNANPRTEFARQWQELTARYGGKLDKSRADFMICRRLLQAGFSVEEIEGAMREVSIASAERKAGHEEDYILRTLKAAGSSSFVV